MKFLKYLVLVILGLIAIYVIACFASNKVSEVVVEKEIGADVNKVFTAVNDFNHYKNWNEWSRMDTAGDYKVMGSEKVGDKFMWEGEVIGTGSLEKIAFNKNENIHNKMVFVKPFENTGDDLWAFEDNNGTTHVTWTTKTEAPWYMRPVMGMMLTGTMEKGLSNMEEYIATMPENKNGNFAEEMMSETKYIGIRNKIAASEIGQTLEKAYGKLGEFCKENNIEMAGMPMAIYYTWENDSTDMVAAFPINQTVEGNEFIDYGVINACDVISTTHFGSYESSGESHEAMYSYFQNNGLEMQGPAIEIYLNDPTEVSTENIQTKIIYPIAVSEMAEM